MILGPLVKKLYYVQRGRETFPYKNFISLFGIPVH